MFPSAPDFRTATPTDGWLIGRSSPGVAAAENDDICQVSGAFFLRAVSLFMRFQMRLNASRDPYILDGTRYAIDSMIDREFLAPTAWTRKILTAYNEYLNRANRTINRPYLETGAVTRSFLQKLLNGGVLNAGMAPYSFVGSSQWQGRFLDSPPEAEGLFILPENAIMPEMGQALGLQPWPLRLSLGCTGRGNLDPAYVHPAERSQSGGGSSFGLALGLGLFALIVTSK